MYKRQFVTFRLINKETGEIKTQEVFFGDFPIMTEMGTFIINGGERIIVSQLVRSPGVYFNDKVDKNGKVGYGSTVIPNRGAWLELETDSKDIAYTRIDRTRKIPFTTLVRALGFSGDDEIMDIFGDSELVRNTIEKDIHKNPADSRTDEALKEIYERLRPGEPKTADSSRSSVSYTHLFLTAADNSKFVIDFIVIRKCVVQILNTFTVDVDSTVLNVFTCLTF